MPASDTIDLNELRVAADAACRLLKLLSNPDRLLLLCRLAQGEACVSELAEELRIVQPTLSQQLGVLRDDHMVATRRDGKHIYYRLASAQALAVISTLQAQFCSPSKPKKRSS
ncbi:MAG: metalloregulator ArsR/SmtB family transcription factor [Betaproteobacteria bacterium]